MTKNVKLEINNTGFVDIPCNETMHRNDNQIFHLCKYNIKDQFIGSVRLLASEIITQVQNGNLLFTGIDGQGAHATLYIEDKPTRIEADFETETTNQIVICEEVVKNLFAKNKKDFELELMKLIKTRAEEFAIIGIIRNLKINDYEKVRAVENLTGLRV